MSDAEREIREWCWSKTDRGTNRFIELLRSHGLDDEQIVVVIRAIDWVCNDCWDSDDRCTCTNDE